MKILKLLESYDLSKLTKPPSEKVGRREHVVGVASIGAKKLFGLQQDAVLKHNRLAETIVELESAHRNEHKGQENQDLLPSCKAHRAKMDALNERKNILLARYEAFGELFWNSLRAEFPVLLDKEVIGIRKGFKVVWLEKTAHEKVVATVYICDSR